jgi:glycosyltransferase involved in cell wall biosynthesis
MRILLINKFLYRKGGDAICTLDTGALLRDQGHEVKYWGMDHPDNPEYPGKRFFVPYIDYGDKKSLSQKMRAACNLMYSFRAQKHVGNFLSAFLPDIVHVHNFAHQISPSILDVFKKYKIPVVMTIHDYKLVCASYLLYAGGKPCRACSGKRYYHCMLKKCVKDSFAKSTLNTIEMYLHHKMLHIYDKIDIFISPSIFLKDMLYIMGFSGRITVIPNFIDSTKIEPNYNSKGYLLYFGRLSGEKGLYTLLHAVQGLDREVHIVGTGPYEAELIDIVKKNDMQHVRFLGYLTGEKLQNEVVNALCVIQPSEWYENNPRSVLEAFAYGKPVIGTSIGGIPELVTDHQTGLTFEPGNADDLREKIRYVLEHKHETVEMGRNARKLIEANFHPANHYASLMKIYQDTLKEI